MELLYGLPLILAGALIADLFNLDIFGNGSSNDINLPSASGTDGTGGAAASTDPFADATELSAGDDTNTAGSNDDIIKALAGDDTVNGSDGQDVIFGNTGTDALFGGNGDDLLIGDDGTAANLSTDARDVLDGGDGNDILIGNGGDDGMFGQAGNDMMLAGFGADRLFGGGGDDTLEGQRGEDFVRGGSGNDIVSGNMLYQGIMTAEEGYDLLTDPNVNSTADITRLGELQQRDDFQADTVYGDAGNDMLYIGDRDTGIGGAGNDTFFISPEAGTNTATIVQDFVQGEDAIVLQYSGATAPTFTLGNDGSGNATITVNGTVVATVSNAATTLTTADVTLQPV
ncbi:MAG: calcium-binding protein [Planktomarina sp.]